MLFIYSCKIITEIEIQNNFRLIVQLVKLRMLYFVGVGILIEVFIFFLFLWIHIQIIFEKIITNILIPKI